MIVDATRLDRSGRKKRVWLGACVESAATALVSGLKWSEIGARL